MELFQPIRIITVLSIFYSGKDNSFWKILEQVFNCTFKYNDGEEAVEERKLFQSSQGIGITDMHQLCYRKNDFSTDESLFPIILNDIFSILDNNLFLERFIITSRSEIFGALGLLKTYFLQHHLKLPELERRADKILKGSFIYKDREIRVLVPYSPSPRLIKSKTSSIEELVKMYQYCLNN